VAQKMRSKQAVRSEFSTDPLTASSDSSEGIASTTYVAKTTPCTLTLPAVTGTYVVTLHTEFSNSSANRDVAAAIYDIGASTALAEGQARPTSVGSLYTVNAIAFVALTGTSKSIGVYLKTANGTLTAKNARLCAWRIS
jgi:hypothetical protein